MKHQSNSIKALQTISNYLKTHNIEHNLDLFNQSITFLFRNCPRCPDGIIEGCIYFLDDFMEVRVYYSELGSEICKKSKKLPEIFRLLNFLQSELWPRVSCGDTLYKSQILVCPRFYITEDGNMDITSTMLIPYTYFWLDQLAFEDYITAAIPELMDRLSPIIFLVLSGDLLVDDAIKKVEKEILQR